MITIDHLTKRYRNITAVDGLSFAVGPGRVTFTQLDINRARCPALFCSGLQPSDAPAADMVAAAISRAVQQFGVGGCAGRMAQEFGDHPDAAASRMRWVGQLITKGSATQREQAAA